MWWVTSSQTSGHRPHQIPPLWWCSSVVLQPSLSLSETLVVDLLHTDRDICRCILSFSDTALWLVKISMNQMLDLLTYNTVVALLTKREFSLCVKVLVSTCWYSESQSSFRVANIYILNCIDVDSPWCSSPQLSWQSEWSPAYHHQTWPDSSPPSHPLTHHQTSHPAWTWSPWSWGWWRSWWTRCRRPRWWWLLVLKLWQPSSAPSRS